MGGTQILHFPFHTTKESRRETQPYVSASGLVFTWDGRLDNRVELVRDMGKDPASYSSDAAVVAGAYEKWGAACLPRLIGDWALAIWDPNKHRLVLAKDFLGSRHLYYSFDENQVVWCTVLDPLILLARKSLGLCEEYIAGWLSYFPAVHLTPYVGIHSVPPSSFVTLDRAKCGIRRYWDFDPFSRISYRTDSEYEEHFVTVFAEAVRRRLRSDSPVAAELSGGMDSSSIVCLADILIGRGVAETCRLDTLSYYNDSEPNWNERPYFSKVEQQRGRAGCHINLGFEKNLVPEYGIDRLASTPASGGRLTESQQQAAAYLLSQGNRVVLSGIGGDEVLGGVPTPTPELADLLASGRFCDFGRQLAVWALVKRKPLGQLATETLRAFLPRWLIGVRKQNSPAPWLDPHFTRRYRAAIEGYDTRFTVFGPSPSFRSNLSTFDVIRRQLACSPLAPQPLCEKRYPYLDRDLLEFLFSIPRNQIVRPHERRSLMRRALAGIVPEEILRRRRKAFVVRGNMAAISTNWSTLFELTQEMLSSSIEICDAHRLVEALQRARQGQEIPLVFLMRTLRLECWLRHLRNRNLLSTTTQSSSTQQIPLTTGVGT
jgi:asparagine synthase (glutamine-hydrolysing)